MDTKSENDVGAADKLPNALDVALTKTGPVDSTPTTTATLQRIRSGRRPAHGEPLPELHEGKMVLSGTPMVEGISFSCAEPICTDDGRAKFCGIQVKMVAFLGESEKWSLSKVDAFI